MRLVKLQILIVFCFQLISGYCKGQNLALHKSYTLSISPNYQYSAPSSDRTSLTDGIYTKGYFWTKSTTVGWMGTNVSICIDLGAVKSIGELTFNTVRSTKQGVDFPKNIYVFVSQDDKNYSYVGDAANTPKNEPGPYEIKQFKLREINASARYVICVAVRKSFLLFCDEIQVLQGKRNNSYNAEKLFPKENLNSVVDSFEILDFNQKSLQLLVNKLFNNSTIKTDAGFLKTSALLQNNNLSKSELQSAKTKIGELHASRLKSEYQTPFVVESCNPFGVLSPLNISNGIPKEINYRFSIPQNYVQYGSFVITNLNSTPQQFLIKLLKINRSVNDIELFQVPFVPGSDYNLVPDPLLPVRTGVSIDPGYSRMFIFKILAIKKGYSENVLEIRSERKAMQIKINTQVNVLFRDNFNQYINANVWAYLNYPMLKGRDAEVASDLKLHHINTIVVPPGILPNMLSSDYTPFIKYIKNFEGVTNFLLYMDYTSTTFRNGYNDGRFMSDEWKVRFIDWYKRVVKAIKENGFPNSQIFLYPYDEVRGHDIDDFINFIKWSRSAVPRIKFYATLANEQSVESLLPLVNVAQISSAYLGTQELPPHKCEIWLYRTESAGRSLSPYSYYRLMSWQAFANDYKGVGFWNYADEGPNRKFNLISEPLPNTRGYSVVYNGQGKDIISSRRWEAFRLGIEDYSIISAYADKVGAYRAKVLVRKVLADSLNFYKADSVRNAMIRNLLGSN